MQNSYMQVLKVDGLIRLDPRTKIIMLLVINISAFTVHTWYIMALAALLPLSLLALDKKIVLSVVLTFIITFTLGIHILFNEASYGALSIFMAMLTSVINRMGPGLIMGYYLLSTTTVSELIAAMERARLPKQIIIPISVMFRFFPTIKEESASINDAMRMRGISMGKSRGGMLALLEYRLVPLFISCVKIGDELSCSALTRGLGSPVKRTNICKIGFGRMDLLYGVLSAMMLVLLMYSKGA